MHTLFRLVNFQNLGFRMEATANAKSSVFFPLFFFYFFFSGSERENYELKSEWKKGGKYSCSRYEAKYHRSGWW